MWFKTEMYVVHCSTFEATEYWTKSFNTSNDTDTEVYATDWAEN
jgi:hypothetical protein